MRLSSCPAMPTNGSPWRSSSPPGASPMKQASASIGPTPKTVWVRVATSSGHRSHRLTRSARRFNSTRRLAGESASTTDAASVWVWFAEAIGTGSGAAFGSHSTPAASRPARRARSCRCKSASVIALLPPPNPVVLQREFVVLPQGVPLPVLREEDSSQVRVAREHHAAQVKRLPLVPVGRGPDAAHGRYLGKLTCNAILPPGQDQLHDEPVLVREAREVVDNFEMWLKPGLGDLLRVGLQVVHAGNAIEQVEPQSRVVAEKGADLHEPRRVHRRERVDGIELFAGHCRPESFFECGDNLRGAHASTSRL